MSGVQKRRKGHFELLVNLDPVFTLTKLCKIRKINDDQSVFLMDVFFSIHSMPYFLDTSISAIDIYDVL